MKKRILAAAMSILMAAPMTALSASAESKMIGDANGDGKFTIADLVQVQNYLLGHGSILSAENCDVVSDGVVDTFDLVALRQKLLKTPMYAPYTADLLSRNVAAEDVKGKTADRKFIMSQTKFALNLFKSEFKADEDIMISPYSVMQALAMTANGADGDTKAEMESALGGIEMDELNKYLYTERTSQPNKEKCKLTTANSIWAREGRIEVYPEFLQTNANYYNADFFKAAFDYSTLEDINNWINVNTDGMIPEMLKEISEEAVLYLINAVTFDAEWAMPYDEYSVHEGDFTAYNGKTEKRDMMYSSEYTYLQDDNATGFIKEYSGGKYAFAAILPNEGVTVEEYISGLDAEAFNNMLSNKTYTTVITSLPKFKTESDMNLNNTLKSMGMPTAFTRAADFTKMGKTLTDLLYISNVMHKTFIEVNEKGTRAGAATVVEMADGACIEKPKKVYLDRPFVYCIIDTETNIPVFMGALNTNE